jgi:hypothetical protein
VTDEKNRLTNVVNLHSDVTASFYICLVTLFAYIIFIATKNNMFSLTPLLSLGIIITLRVKQHWIIENSWRQTIVSLLTLPLIISTSLTIYKQLSLLLMGGISSIGSDVRLDFSNATLYTIQHNFLYLCLPAITILSFWVLLVNLSRPIIRKLFRITLGILLPIVIIFGGFSTVLLWGSGSHLIKEIKINDYFMRVYELGYSGATSGSGIAVDIMQEKDLPMGVKFVKSIIHYAKCDNAQIDIIGINTIRITPLVCAADANAIAQNITLLPFHETPFLTRMP